METRQALKRYRRLLAWVSAALLVVVAVSAFTGISHYRPLRLGTNTMDLDVKTIGDGIEDARMVVPYVAGHSFSYATSVENTGSYAVTLTGAVIDTNPPSTDRANSIPGPDGRPSACEVQVCLATATWAYGPFRHGADQNADLVETNANWHPFGKVHLAPGASVMVRLTFLFNSCGQDNEGWETLDGWDATFNFFGKHTQRQPFSLPLTITPLPASQRHLPASCPAPVS